MKRFYVIILFSLLLFGVVGADQGFFYDIDIKFGASSSNQRLTYPDGGTRTFDVLSGQAFVLSFNLFENELNSGALFQFYVDAGMVEKGMKDKYHYYLPTGERTTDYHENKISYFSIVPQARMTLVYKRLFMYGYLGVRLDFYMNHSQESEYEELFLTSDGSRYITWDDLYGSLNSMVPGGTVGGGWGFLLGPEKNFKMFTELRVDQDLTTASEDILELDNTTCWIFFFGVGYRFK